MAGWDRDALSRTTRAAVLLGLTLLLVGVAAAPAVGELVPNDVAQARKAGKAARDIPIGKSAKVQIGVGAPKVVVLLRSVTVSQPDGSITTPSNRAIKADVRIENRGSKAAEVPEIALYCKDDPESTNWFAQSTVQPYEDLAPGSFEEGAFYAAYPDGCKAPTLRFQAAIRVNNKPAGIEYPLGLP